MSFYRSHLTSARRFHSARKQGGGGIQKEGTGVCSQGKSARTRKGRRQHSSPYKTTGRPVLISELKSHVSRHFFLLLLLLLSINNIFTRIHSSSINIRTDPALSHCLLLFGTEMLGIIARRIDSTFLACTYVTC